MATIVLRSAKGSPLSNAEADQNLININNELVSKLPSTSYTASDVLAKLVTVDGTGSGVDADLLDGLDSSSILPVASNKSSVVTRDSSGNFTANTITATVTNANNLNGVTGNGFISRISINNHIARVLTGSGTDIIVTNGDGISGNPTISAGSNLAKRDSTNTYSQVQNFSLITANGILNDGNNNIFAGVNNASVTSTDGFLYVPTVTGIPAGTPTTNAGRSPIVWDATNNKMWVYSGGLWNSIAILQKFNASKILPFTATQSGNVLTGTFASTILDYRNASLSNGTSTELTNSTLTLSIPAASSLGLISGLSSPILWLVAYNNGSPVLCATNLLGNGNLDETGLISPTTISSSSNASNIIYSNSTVVSNSPYRIVGITYNIYTTGTGWDNPSLVQGAGGRALDVLSRIGAVKTWQNLTSSRAYNVNYTNTNPYEITIFVKIAGGGSTFPKILINSNVVVEFATAGIGTATITIPPLGIYSVSSAATPGTLIIWSEYK